jgi:predicted DNA-binding transcriptional regulator AlpA
MRAITRLVDDPAVGPVFLTTAQVRRRYGGISEMTLWRWLRDEAVSFPRPVIISGRRFWHAAELDTWDAARPKWQPPVAQRL